MVNRLLSTPLSLFAGCTLALPAATSARAEIVSLDWLGQMWSAPDQNGPITLAGRIAAPNDCRYNALTYDTSRDQFLSMQGFQYNTGPASLVWFDRNWQIQRSVPVTLQGVPTNNFAMSLAFAPDGALFASMYGDPELYRVDLLTGELTSVPGSPGPCLDFVISADGTMLACTYIPLSNYGRQFARCEYDASTQTFGPSTNIPLADFTPSGYQALALLPDGQLLGGGGGRYRLIDPEQSTSTDLPGLRLQYNDPRGVVIIPTPASTTIALTGITAGFRRRRLTR